MNEDLRMKLTGLTVFGDVLKSDVGTHLRGVCLGIFSGNGEMAMEHYCALARCLAAGGFRGLGDWLQDALRYTEFPYANAVARGAELPWMTEAARRDVQVLSTIAATPCADFKNRIAMACPVSWTEWAMELPEWEDGCEIDFSALLGFYRTNGTGQFARYRAFLWRHDRLLPVERPDFVPEEELWGYKLQRDKVVANTRALVEGRAVNNVLLYGEPGTGKSATVKSLLGMEEFGALRLIEVRKDDLGDLGELLRMLAHRPQKFILFIDDLSFDREDGTYSLVKSALEGGLEPRPANVAVYATSNRRTLVRQNFSDRSGDEVDIKETIQEKTSLAERFGVRIPFTALSRAQFLDMVLALARRQGIELPEEQLKAKAVAWEMRHNGRTPRTAVQFLSSL